MYLILCILTVASAADYGSFHETFSAQSVLLSDLLPDTPVEVETQKTFSIPANEGYTVLITGKAEGQNPISMSLALTSASLDESCEYRYSLSTPASSTHPIKSRNRDLPACRDNPTISCFVQQRDRIGNYDFDNWSFWGDLDRDSCSSGSISLNLGPYFVNDGAKGVSCALAANPRGISNFDVFSCARSLWSFTVDYEINDLTQTFTSTGTATITESGTIFSDDNIVLKLDTTGIQYPGIVDNVLVHSKNEIIQSVFTDLPAFGVNYGYFTHIGYPMNSEGFVSDVHYTAPVANYQTQTCSYGSVAPPDIAQLSYQFANLEHVTGCTHVFPDLTTASSTIYRDPSTPNCPADTNGVEATIIQPSSFTAHTRNCALNRLNFDLTFKGLGTFTVSTEQLSAENIISSTASGSWGTSGTSICMVSNSQGTLSTVNGNLQLISPTVTFELANQEICVAGQLLTPFSNKLNIADGSQISVDISDVDAPAGWLAPEDTFTEGGSQTPGNVNFVKENWWIIVLVLGLTIVVVWLIITFCTSALKAGRRLEKKEQ